jgi:hypothetical protein
MIAKLHGSLQMLQGSLGKIGTVLSRLHAQRYRDPLPAISIHLLHSRRNPRLPKKRQHLLKHVNPVMMEVDVVTHVWYSYSMRPRTVTIRIEHIQRISRYIATLCKTITLAVEEVLLTI